MKSDVIPMIIAFQRPALSYRYAVLPQETPVILETKKFKIKVPLSDKIREKIIYFSLLNINGN